MKKITALMQKTGLALLALSHASLTFAEEKGKNMFPKLDPSLNFTEGNSMSKIGALMKAGGATMLFVAAIVMFVKFMGTVNHGIEVAKKNEGSLTDFTTFMLMAIIQLFLCIGAGYLGYTVITNYNP